MSKFLIVLVTVFCINTFAASHNMSQKVLLDKMEKAAEATRRMFAADPPDAVFVANDHMAFSVMDTLRYDLNLRIPEDVSVIGYDDVPAAQWRAYNLTTVRQPADRMVNRTVEILLAQINGDTVSARTITIDGPLICRGSARLPREWNDEGV